MTPRRCPSNRWTLIVLLAAIAAPWTEVAIAGAQRPPANPNAVTLADFRKRTDAYAALQKTLSSKVGRLDDTRSPTEIATRERTLGEALRKARAQARQGDIFTAAAGALFRAIIREEFSHRSRLALEDRDEAQDELPNFTPAVNQIYPTTFPLATFPPGVLNHLPPLPAPLEYRFVQRFLILRDIEANLIVDVLPQAAPAMNALTPPGRGR